MLCQRNDSQTYVTEFKKRFTNFAEKAPIRISFNTTPTGIQVIDEDTDQVYEFDWDYTIPVKTFIHGIKSILRTNCYPRIVKVETIWRPISEQRQIELAAEGQDLQSIPTQEQIELRTTFCIDKVIVIKDIFIVEDETTHKLYRYKLHKSSVFFLKKLREGRLSPTEAADYFFQHSELLNEIVPLEGDS